MRPGPNSRRARGRNSGGGGGGGGGSGGGGGGQQRRPNALPNRNQTIDSNGPDIRIRGNVFQVYDKYMGLARDAQASGDRVMAENYQQHAEHYVRIINAMNEAYGAPQHQPSQDSSRDQPGVDADYDPLTNPPPQQQRREFEARNDGGDRQQRRDYEPRNDGGDRQQGGRDFEPRGEGDRPQRREFEGRGGEGGGDRQNRDQGFRNREQGFRDNNRPPRDRDQNREQQGQGRDQGQRERFGGPRDNRPDYRGDRPQQSGPVDLNAPQPHIPSPLDPAPADIAVSSASFGADPRDQDDSGLDTELALPASIIARPRRPRPPRAPAPAEAAPSDQPVPAAPVEAAFQPPGQPEASAQPGLPGVAGEQTPAAPKRRPGRPRKVKAEDTPPEPSNDK
jgi:hypothetical protein